MRVSCMSPLSSRFCAILCNSGKIGEAVPKKPPKIFPAPGLQAVSRLWKSLFHTVEPPKNRQSSTRIPLFSAGFRLFPPFGDGAADRRQGVCRGVAGRLHGACRGRGHRFQGRAARSGRKERGAQAPSGKRRARWRQPEPRARPTNAPARRGRRRKGDSRGGRHRQRRFPLQFSPFGNPLSRFPLSADHAKGGKPQRDTARLHPRPRNAALRVAGCHSAA